MNREKKTTKRLTVRVPEEIEEMIRNEAERRGTSVNQTMIYMITEYLKGQKEK